MGVGEGNELILSRCEGGFQLTTIEEVAKEAQSYFQQFKQPSKDVVEELINERRQEALKENGGQSGATVNRRG